MNAGPLGKKGTPPNEVPSTPRAQGLPREVVPPRVPPEQNVDVSPDKFDAALREAVVEAFREGKPVRALNIPPVRAPKAPRIQAPAGNASEEIQAILKRHNVHSEYPPKVMAEVEQILKSPGIDDKTLTKLTHLPFVTIDNDDSRDLDQAVYLEKRPDGGFEVYYALSDASFYVNREKSPALFAEALVRGTSIYLPDSGVPMLPRELSEGVVSLNEGVDRRAVVFKISLSDTGVVENSEHFRARIHSQKKLSYRLVQEYYDTPEKSELGGKAWSETLDLLKEIGGLRMDRAREDGRVPFVRADIGVEFEDAAKTRLRFAPRQRYQVEEWNAEISILTNTVGAAKTGLFKHHPPPPEHRLESMARLIESVVARNKAPVSWNWDTRESLADYVARLPKEGKDRRLFQAIQAQIFRVNNQASFTTTPGPHTGLAVPEYSRLSAPMREIGGIITHALLLDGPDAFTPEELEIFARQANRAESRQRMIESELRKIALDHYFLQDRDLAEEDRPVHTATITGVSPEKIYALLDEPFTEVKLYVSELDGRYSLSNRSSALKGKKGAPDLLTGSEIQLRVDRYDSELGRWILKPRENRQRQAA